MGTGIGGLSLALVGGGRVGKAFARSWLGAGGHLGEVISRTDAGAQRAAGELGSGRPRAISDARGHCDVLAIAVSDDAIAAVAGELSGRMSSSAAFHFSGALPASRLEVLASGGAALGSLHPLRVFSGRPGEDWQGAFVAVEGDDIAAEQGLEVAAAFGATGHRIRPEDKPRYHAAATLAAGGVVSLLSLAARAWTRAGIGEEQARIALSGLAAGAAGTASREPFPDALTGPIARRDLDTVRAHRDALGNDSDLLELYRLLARETLRLTAGRGREEEILRILAGG